MKTRHYHEASLIERILPPIGKLVAWIDAFFLTFWIKALEISDKIVEKEMIMEGMFLSSGITGMMFIVKSVAQNSEFQFTQIMTFKTCAAMLFAVYTLRFLCSLSAKRMRAYSVAAVETALGALQPLRSASAIFLLSLGGYEWYRYGYFYLAIATLFAVLGMYTHSAIIYLQTKKRVEQFARVKELSGV